MANEKLQKLVKYQSDVKSRLESKDLPPKQKNREASYRSFLTKELKQVSEKIEALKTSNTK